MFEKVMSAASRIAEARTQARIAALAEQIQGEGLQDIQVSSDGEGVTLSGRGLKRRFALDPALRWLTARLR